MWSRWPFLDLGPIPHLGMAVRAVNLVLAPPPGVAVATPEPSTSVPELSVSETAFGHVSSVLLSRIGPGPLPESWIWRMTIPHSNST